jgi:hypothetical protein
MCIRINRMMFIKDGHPLALEAEDIQDDVINEDDKTGVKGKAHCVIKMNAQRALKLIRQAEAAVVEIDIHIKDRTALVYGWYKGCVLQGKFRWVQMFWAEDEL